MFVALVVSRPTVFGLWRNCLAAMPSLHIGWATWCVFALFALARRRWMRLALLSYPPFTLACIVITLNHFWIDGVGGIIFVDGYPIGDRIHRWNERRLDTRQG